MKVISRLLLFAFVALTIVGARAQAASAPEYVPGQVIVKYRATTNLAQRGALKSAYQLRSLKSFGFIRAEQLQVESGRSVEEAIAALQKDPRVEYAEPNYVWRTDVTPNDPRYPELYGMHNTGQTGGTPGADISAPNAWDVFTGDPNVMVGVIDTGIDYNHPDLAANVWTNPGEIPGNSVDDDGNGYVDDVHGYDFVNNDGDPMDDNGHGSHCSGTIMGVGNNGVGVAGVCWTGKLVGIKFLSAGGSGSTDGAIAGVQYAITVGVRLTSNSWGGGGFSQALLDAINAAGAANQLFVAAAGNSGTDNDVSPHYPSSYDSPYIVAVAATDHNDQLADFSCFGATSVDLAAPGVDILSCQPGGGYQLLSGTSMATPHVSGAVALAMGRLPALTNLQIKQLILLRADPKASLTGRVLTGARLNAFMSIADPDSTPPSAIADLGTSNAGSNTMQLSWTAPGDDGNVGRASSYEIRYSTSPIDESNFASGTLVVGPDPLPSGSAQSFEVAGLSFLTTYYFAIKAHDEFNNGGPISNVATGTTLGIPDLAASPTSFSSSLITGATDTQVLTLQNTADGTLDFTIPTPALLASQAVHPFVDYDKYAGDTRVGPPVIDGSGGPDGFGYRWVDSDEPGGPAFSWVDITGVGTQATVTGDDALSGAVSIGFDFPFYGNAFNTVRIGTNGMLTFTGTSSPYSNQQLPNAGAPANLLAPMWDDLDFGTTPRAYYYNDGTRFIVSYVNAPHYSSGGPYTFQVILYPSGEIRYQYLTLGSPTNSATVGIQNANGTAGTNVAFNTTYLHDNLAIRMFAIPQWLTVTPTSGRIPAGGSQQVSVHFDASGLLGGIYNGEINVLSNDPDESPTVLAAQLHVTGAPDIAVNPASLAFGTVFVGASPTRNLVVSNPGTDVLTISNIASDDAYVTVAPSSFSLNPSGAQNVTVTYHPTAVASTNATLTISSDDPDQPTITVPVTGEAVPAPSFTTSPDSFSVTLATNTATSQTLHIANNGGSNFNWTATTLLGNEANVVKVFGDADNVVLDKGAADVQHGPVAASAGGPDAFGYTYQDSDELGGPAFDWVDISTTGTSIALTGDDANAGPLPIGFNFPFYGASMTQFRICTNGWISFSSTLTSYSNVALPNNGSGAPENMLAVYWDDFNFGTTPRAYYQYDGNRLIVQYQAVPRYLETAPNTFQAILYPNGTIVYQYLSMGATLLNSGTIGIQNATRNDGLQAVFNAAYVHNNLAIRFRPPARFLTVTPESGTIPAGGSADLTVGFNAAGLFGGQYTGAVRITGNDPILPQKDVPARLTVNGVPDLATNPPAVSFGNVYVGAPQVRQLIVQNTGTDLLSVQNIVSDNAAFNVDQTSFNIAPLSSALVYVTFNPAAAQPYAGSLTIASNDPDTPSYVVPLSGAGVYPPEITVSPATLKAALATTLGPTALTKDKLLVIQNTGGADLNWTVDATLGSPPAKRLASAAKAEAPRTLAELPKDDPGSPGVPTLEASGGPDAFGYRWVDSDEPGGPAFAWQEISGVGTPIALTGDDQNVGPFPLPFAFNFYGTDYNQFYVCSNGWVSFTSTATTYTNTNLPDPSAPGALLAAFWDDQDFRTTGDAFYYYDGSKFIIEFQAVPHYSSGGPYTYQVLLYPNGNVDYQYLDMQSTRLNEATIGIQDASGSDGLAVVYNANYVHNNLRVRFSRAPEWMTLGTLAGTTPAGGADTVVVHFDATGLEDGDYSGTVHVASNDLDEPTTSVPVSLHVGVASAVLDITPGVLNSLGGPNWVQGRVTPPNSLDPHGIVAGSLLVEGAVGVAAGAPVTYDPTSATFSFDRLALLPALGEGKNVPVGLIGEVDGETWFTASDVIRVLKPTLFASSAAPYTGGANVTLSWQPPAEAAPTRYELWWSADGGATWMLLRNDLVGTQTVWTVPMTPTTGGVLELMAFDAQGYMGSAVLGPFEVTAPSLSSDDRTVPSQFALRFTSANPARGSARLELALPVAGAVDVRVHDVRGALVRTIAAGEFAAGRHPLTWDGRDASGSRVGAGV